MGLLLGKVLYTQLYLMFEAVCILLHFVLPMLTKLYSVLCWLLECNARPIYFYLI
jgi:hypothetical protein